MSDKQVDVLAIAAHPDDAELTCGGTLVKAARSGYRTAIVDLTRGEMGTRGSPEKRAGEAAAAAEVLGVSQRVNAELPDAGLHNTDDTRKVVVALLRQLRPRVVILPFPVGRHPDHRIASELGRDACFLSKLAKYDADGEPHKIQKIIYAMAYREDPVKPTFVVDISEVFEQKLEAVACYSSQFEGVITAGELYPTGQDLFELIRTQNHHYGSLIRAAYGEPFVTEETVCVDDIVKMGVLSI
jgi:bacillithiol biosynthesis deacetylase BshB1